VSNQAFNSNRTFVRGLFSSVERQYSASSNGPPSAHQIGEWGLRSMQMPRVNVPIGTGRTNDLNEGPAYSTLSIPIQHTKYSRRTWFRPRLICLKHVHFPISTNARAIWAIKNRAIRAHSRQIVAPLFFTGKPLRIACGDVAPQTAREGLAELGSMARLRILEVGRNGFRTRKIIAYVCRIQDQSSSERLGDIIGIKDAPVNIISGKQTKLTESGWSLRRATRSD